MHVPAYIMHQIGSPRNSQVEALIVGVPVFGDGAFKEGIKVK